MGGTIWARQRPEGGSEFGFTLRVLPDDESAPRGAGARQRRRTSDLMAPGRDAVLRIFAFRAVRPGFDEILRNQLIPDLGQQPGISRGL